MLHLHIYSVYFILLRVKTIRALQTIEYIIMALQFVTVVLLAAFIYLLIKYQSVKKKMISETSVMLHESKELTSILQNINVYYLLIDRDFIVHNTNYYTLNHLTPAQGERKKVGDLLLVDIWIAAILTGVKWCIVVLICTSLIMSDVENLFCVC